LKTAVDSVFKGAKLVFYAAVKAEHSVFTAPFCIMTAENENVKTAAEAVDALAPEQIPVPKTSALSPGDDFLDRVWGLVAALASGEITPYTFESRLEEAVADEVDIPYVPSALEEQAVGLVVDGIKAILISLVR
jgi:hypothetical protein